MISTHQMTLGMTQISTFYVLIFTFVWLIGVMKNLIFGQQASAFHRERVMAGRSCEEGVQKVHSNWLSSILHGIIDEKVGWKGPILLWQCSSICPTHNVYPLALHDAYQCSNQCENVYSESRHAQHVDSRIYIIKSRIVSSSEKDLNQHVLWKKTKDAMCSTYHLMEIWLKVSKSMILEKMAFTGMFHLHFMHQ